MKVGTDILMNGRKVIVCLLMGDIVVLQLCFKQSYKSSYWIVKAPCEVTEGIYRGEKISSVNSIDEAMKEAMRYAC